MNTPRTPPDVLPLIAVSEELRTAWGIVCGLATAYLQRAGARLDPDEIPVERGEVRVLDGEEVLVVIVDLPEPVGRMEVAFPNGWRWKDAN